MILPSMHLAFDPPTTKMPNWTDFTTGRDQENLAAENGAEKMRLFPCLSHILSFLAKEAYIAAPSV